MPVLSIPNTFVPFTKIVSSQQNTNFTAITTWANTTKLDYLNLQDAGVRSTNLSGNGATAGQVLGYNGTIVTWVASSLGQLYNVILGSAAQVTSGVATHSTFASVTQADGDRVLILPGYVTSEAWSITKKLFVAGLGNTSTITGTVTFTNTSDYSQMRSCRVTDTITLNSGADGILVSDIWLASGKSFTDNGSGNLLTAVQET